MELKLHIVKQLAIQIRTWDLVYQWHPILATEFNFYQWIWFY
jgi:hypothetical protein